MKKIVLSLFLVTLYSPNSFSGPGSSKSLEEGESSQPTRAVPVESQAKWNPNLEKRMREIARKDPLKLSLEDKCFVDIANSLGHPTAVHIIRQYYSSPSSSQSSYRDYHTNHFSLTKFMKKGSGKYR